MKERFGKEYPAAAFHDGARMPLAREGRWSRYYEHPETKAILIVSRFQDGSASITLEDLQREWPCWDSRERMEFSLASSWLSRSPEFPDILRYIMRVGEADDWSGIAGSVGNLLPSDEAFDLLSNALAATPLGRTGNIVQGIAMTKHRAAQELLRRHLDALWRQPSLWDDDLFTNWIAFDAITSIEHLIELGVPPDELRDRVKLLASHVCVGTQRSCRGFLGKHYPWLSTNSDE